MCGHMARVDPYERGGISQKYDIDHTYDIGIFDRNAGNCAFPFPGYSGACVSTVQ